MSVRPRLAVAAVLAVGAAAAGGFYLWPSGRHMATCVSHHAPVPAAAQAALSDYAGRIRHDVERTQLGERDESWSDATTGRVRQVEFQRGRITSEFGIVPGGRFERIISVLYDAHVWMSRRLRSPRNVTTGNAAAEHAQTSRDEVARGRATIVGKEALDGRQTVHLSELVRPVPTLPALHVDMWVDPITYVTVRTRFTVRGHSSITDETWLPRTAANVAATKIVIPTGFKHRRNEGTLLTSTDSMRLPAHCA